MEIINLPLNKIKRDPKQPRQSFDNLKIKEMAQSMKTEGIINPVEIDKNFVIVTGEMRWRAAQVAGLTEIPCKIIDIVPEERFRRQFIENVHHNTMSDWDTAKALKKLLEADDNRRSSSHKGGYPDEGIRELSRQIGKATSYIIEKLNLLEASKEFKKAVRQGLSSTYIRAISRVPDEYKKVMEEKIIAGHFKTRDDALEVATAIRRSPHKAEEILKATSRDELFRIAPRDSDLVRESYDPVRELVRIVNDLVDWLRTNPPTTVGRMHAGPITVNLGGAISAINKWGEKSNQLKLEKGKNAN